MAKRPGTKIILKAVRARLGPVITELGFTGKYPAWRRDLNGETHFLEIYSRKYGGGFGVTGAWRKRIRYVEPGGYSLPADEAQLAHTEFDNRASLVRIKQVGVVETGRMAWRSVGDFSYEHIAQDEAACRELVEDAAELLPALDHWLKTREPGLGIDTKRHRMRSVQSEQISWHFATSVAGAFALENTIPATPILEEQRRQNLAPEYPA